MKEIEKKDAPDVSGGVRVDIQMPVLPGPPIPWPLEPFPPFPMTPYNPDAPFSDPPAV
jgi:hypothetical protein